MSPVTHEAETAVKKLMFIGVDVPSREAIGSDSSMVPINIKMANPTAISCMPESLLYRFKIGFKTPSLRTLAGTYLRV
jgi:hypothetical protein